jgi:hypothetical protein
MAIEIRNSSNNGILAHPARILLHNRAPLALRACFADKVFDASHVLAGAIGALHCVTIDIETELNQARTTDAVSLHTRQAALKGSAIIQARNSMNAGVLARMGTNDTLPILRNGIYVSAPSERERQVALIAFEFGDARHAPSFRFGEVSPKPFQESRRS